MLCHVPYTDPQIQRYIQRYYAGRVDYAYLRDGHFTLVECARCGLIYQRELPDDALMQQLYDEWIDPDQSFQKPRRATIWQYSLLAKEIANLVQYSGKQPDDLHMLDYGMGWGTWGQLARGLGCNVYGYEISQHRLAYARSMGFHMLNWDEIPTYRFDYIHTEQVFEHLPRPLETLLSLAQTLQPGGIIRISVPNGHDIKRRLRVWDWQATKGMPNHLGPVIPLEHINCFRYHVIVNLGHIAGLRPVYIPGAFHIVNTSSPAMLKSSLGALLRPLYYRLRKAQTSVYLQKPAAR